MSRTLHWRNPGPTKRAPLEPGAPPLKVMRALVRRRYAVVLENDDGRWFWLTETGQIARQTIANAIRDREMLEHQKGRLGAAIDRAREA